MLSNCNFAEWTCPQYNDFPDVADEPATVIELTPYLPSVSRLLCAMLASMMHGRGLCLAPSGLQLVLEQRCSEHLVLAVAPCIRDESRRGRIMCGTVILSS